MSALQGAMDKLGLEVDIAGIIVSPPTKTVVVTLEKKPPEPDPGGLTALQITIIALLSFSCLSGCGGVLVWKRALIMEKYAEYKEKRREKKYGKQADDAEEEDAEEGGGAGRPSNVSELQLEDS
jgi:hypothetical protein